MEADVNIESEHRNRIPRYYLTTDELLDYKIPDIQAPIPPDGLDDFGLANFRLTYLYSNFDHLYSKWYETDPSDGQIRASLDFIPCINFAYNFIDFLESLRKIQNDYSKKSIDEATAQDLLNGLNFF